MSQETALDYAEMIKHTFSGMQVHVCPHLLARGDLWGEPCSQANTHELRVAEELLEETKSWTLGER